MPADPDRVKSLFLQAVERPPADRPAFVAAVPDPDERAELHRLLLAHHSPDARLDQTDPHPTGDIGQEVAGRYKLLERIGEGGMGTVWMAEQRTPVKRLVALKLIKLGLDTKAVLARFEAERQALAIMDHPSIARVLDAGETSDGRPFFVMELVKGVPITRFCDEAKLTPRQRLELFVPVCQAIQHAHQKGVIHRDIKPGNVLVALYDGRPVPKVIDFGVAKAAGQPLTEKTLHTGFGAVVGTPEYMSPEQASFNQLDIDTRSDVYSLGVLLYELLTGGPPFGGKELEKAGLLEMLRVVREQEPPRPSTKLATSAKLPALAATRGTEPARLAGLVRGEVDWIVMKALEKDRNRRYETALGLAADVSRHLAGEPVQAVPPSVGYRLRKWAAKHRGPVTAATVVALALLTGAAVSTVFAVRAERELQRALLAEAQAVEQKQVAERLSLGLMVDARLHEMKSDTNSGLLRLAQLYRQVPPDQTSWRQYFVSCILTAGQDYAWLLPPHSHRDGDNHERQELSPDGRAIVTFGRGDVRVWDVRTGRSFVARQGDEDVLEAGWGAGGRLLYTDALDGVVRVWEADTGRLRGATAARPTRHHPTRGRNWFSDWQPGSMTAVYPLAADRLLTASHHDGLGAEVRRRFSRWTRSVGARQRLGPPVELWDANSGRLVRRLNLSAEETEGLRYIGDRWLVTRSGDAAWRVFAADSGAEVARLGHAPLMPAGEICSSPDGTRIAVACRTHSSEVFESWLVDWDTATWQPTRVQGRFSPYSITSMTHLTADAVVVTNGGEKKDYRVVHPRQSIVSDEWTGHVRPRLLDGGLFAVGNGMVRELLTGRAIPKPADRRYHPDLARGAVEGRYCWADQPDDLIDLAVEKVVPASLFSPGVPHLSRLGFVSDEYVGGAIFIPTSPPAIDPAALELWTQVAVCGELGPDGAYVEWTESTWQQKWRELAALPLPDPDFPFPGHLARDPLHWLRTKFDDADDADKLPLARELLRRAEAAGDAPEAARWRREVRTRVPEVAPAPRPVVH